MSHTYTHTHTHEPCMCVGLFSFVICVSVWQNRTAMHGIGFVSPVIYIHLICRVTRQVNAKQNGTDGDCWGTDKNKYKMKLHLMQLSKSEHQSISIAKQNIPCEKYVKHRFKSVLAHLSLFCVKCLYRLNSTTFEQHQ